MSENRPKSQSVDTNNGSKEDMTSKAPVKYLAAQFANVPTQFNPTGGDGSPKGATSPRISLSPNKSDDRRPVSAIQPSFVKASPGSPNGSWGRATPSLDALSGQPRSTFQRRSFSAIHPSAIPTEDLQPINKNDDFNADALESLVPDLQKKSAEKTVNDLLAFSRGMLISGVTVLSQGKIKSIGKLTLSEDQSYIYLENQGETLQKVLISDIKGITQKESCVMVIHTESGEELELSLEDQDSLLFAADGLRSLMGEPMDTPEMRELLNLLTEVNAYSNLYQPKPIEPPDNLVFLTPIAQQ